MATSVSPAVKRILQDLKELKENPIVGANAEPLGDNLMKWYGIVLGVKGTPYEDIPIRFQLEFSNNYPNHAPKAYFDIKVPYKGGASYIDASGRQQVCLNLFGNFGHIINVRSEGWTPSYSVQTILLSMQALMMSDMLSKGPNDIQAMAKAARNFKCAITGHRGDDPGKWFPHVFNTQEEVDKILELYKRGPFDPLKDHYLCYVKKASFLDGSFLGYGIQVENARILSLSSPCEYLSLEAFKHGTRRGSTNREFEYWIPILIHSSEWEKVVYPFRRAIRELAFLNPAIAKSSPREHAFKICSSVMNSLVVEIMNNKFNLTANDKFIDGYFAFYRLLLEVTREDSEIVRLADYAIRTFIRFPNSRSKAFVPNLGELLIYLTISQKFTWADLANPFIEECDARNVFWYVSGNNQNPAEFPELSNPHRVSGRAVKVFKATQVSRHLVMFQTKFSQLAKSLNVHDFDANWGRAPEKVREEVKDLYTLVATVEDWDAYFEWLGMPVIGETARNGQLVNALKLSEYRMYHNPPKSTVQTKKYIVIK